MKKCMKPRSSVAGSLLVWKEEKERKRESRNRRMEKKGNDERRKKEWKERGWEEKGEENEGWNEDKMTKKAIDQNMKRTGRNKGRKE